ncbi:MAG: SPFH domain-containing protein [Candidatus Nanoarchaeia archaeon]|nr:SPFH domain-containing protein [Candidatus Nanoarchaeia archaeon]
MAFVETAVGIAGILIFIYLFYVSDIFKWIVVAVLIFIGIAGFFRFFVKKYDEYERGIIFRLGKFNRITGPGWTVVIPFFEKEYTRVDVRTNMMDLFVPSAFTKDDLRIKLNGFIYYRIDNPRKAVLKIKDYSRGIKNLIVSETRNVIGSLKMRDLFSKLDELNDILADKIRHHAWKWGVYVPMVQIEGIYPPDEISEALEKKTIEKEMMQAQVFKAEAKRIAIEAYGEAGKSLDDRALMFIYIKALEELGRGKSTKIIFPAKFFESISDITKSVSSSLGKNIDLSEVVEAFKNNIATGK